MLLQKLPLSQLLQKDTKTISNYICKFIKTRFFVNSSKLGGFLTGQKTNKQERKYYERSSRLQNIICYGVGIYKFLPTKVTTVEWR